MSAAQRRKLIATAVSAPKPADTRSPWRLNTQAGNTRQGESYRVERDAQGRTVHVYRAQPGLKARRVVIKPGQRFKPPVW